MTNAAWPRRARGLTALLLSVLIGTCSTGERPAPPAGAGIDSATDSRTPDDGAVAEPPAAVRARIDTLRGTAETALLRELAPTVQRPAWNRLLITTRSGTHRVFRDDVAGDELRQLYVFRGYLDALDHYLIESIGYPEGGAHLLTDAQTGRTVELDAPPVVSPDGRRFITTSLDLVAGHRPNRIRIYRLQGGAMVLESELMPRGWGGRDPLWLDSGAVRLDRVTVDWDRRPLGYRTSQIRLELDGSEWRIVP